MKNIFLSLLGNYEPDAVAVAFDLKIPTFRHKMYDAYKQGRHPTPEDLLAQFEKVSGRELANDRMLLNR